ncbi:hypothetical protein A6P39_021920 [Streptomyces sp. FXJ1.172]|uniref:hypothetical protein n=1 Tax=Streptomyces sp. FXJ1.172 TaxID=710705 RepID=UPI0007CF6E15|nr:hypothetical protein [Streptomyces sp. FXJ1.172]WEO96476.1 hypothetical protein A6P39_021920 [Streptomyces sp. FXJ1.172]
MHMNSVPQHLLSEDRQEFERLLDEALRSAPHRPELAAVGQRLNSEQLRTMALNATALITEAATAEYQHYVTVREELRHPAMTPAAGGGAGSADPEQNPEVAGLTAALGEAPENTGAGAIAVVAVLAPVLSGTAAVIFLLIGYILKTLNPGQTFAQTMLTAGWVFGAMTAAAILVAAVGLLLTALRNSGSGQAQALDAAHQELDRAREAWRDALLERGILPFLREALAEPGSAPTRLPTTPTAPTGRMPRLGYGRPGFSSPDDGTGSGRPSFTSPDYTSPDFGGPDHRPE